MLKAVIFDLDGIIVDTEPVHMSAFQLTLGEWGIPLTEEEYYANYLAYDDKTFFRRVLEDKDYKHDDALIAEMMERKSRHYDNSIRGHIEILPGVEDFISGIRGKYRLAIGSGALKDEIVHILNFTGIRECFEVIVSADDILNCKPAPDVYIEVLNRLNALGPGVETISASECLVIEDSVSGTTAALSAGMKCLAITNSYTAKELSHAHIIAKSLKGIDPEDLKKIY
ncbi:MAG: HAD family hydrolase [Thermodesulfobacteriota bacterium]